MTVIAKQIVLSVSTVLAMSWGVAHAQTHDGHAQGGVQAEAISWTAGEVKKVDVSQKKITLKHEEIKNLQMPGMTMVFNVKNPKLLEGLTAGDSVKFVAAQEENRYFVTDIKSNR
jgi:Cu/Ag efflux protein CusF